MSKKKIISGLIAVIVACCALSVYAQTDINTENDSIVINFTDDSKNVSAFFAEYDNNGALSDVSLIKRNDGENKIVIPDKNKYADAKLMVWDGMKAMCSAVWVKDIKPEPTEVPTPKPAEIPTSEPTEVPTPKPTEMPTSEPTEVPTPKPTEMSTSEPTETPTLKPTEAPTPTAIPVPSDSSAYGFGTEYNVSKVFNESNAKDVKVGYSGITASSSGENYNCLIIRNSKSANSGYWPYTSSFKADNDAYYLFIGVGGSNNNETVTLKLPNPIKAGKEIMIKCAKPKATQKASTDRTSGNSLLKMTVGSKVIDLQNTYTFDTWKSEKFVSDTDVSEITINLGAWSAIAIEGITTDGLDIPVSTPDPNATPAPEKIKIMPLGDSITNGYSVKGAYRNKLCDLLVENKLSDYVDFVGSMTEGSGYDSDNEGHSGWAIAAVPDASDIEGKGRQGLTTNIDSWMDTYKPEIVLLQVGTNDILSLYELDKAPERLEKLVDKVLAKLPENGKLYLAKIPYFDAGSSMNKTGKNQEEINSIIDTYNAGVTAVAEKKGITLVDINGCITISDLKDGVHPTADGYAKMGTFWYKTLESEIRSRIEK